jgi:hydrogenase maturation protein HypF
MPRHRLERAGMSGSAVAPPPVVRHRLTVSGSVQGVGFRPFVFRLARSLGLVGLVGNDAGGAFVEVEGAPAAVAAFEARLTAEAPPLARIAAVRAVPLAPRGEAGFAIVASVVAPGTRTLVPPDTATCDACLAELDDPADRRYRHPFITCTDCGPRFTVIRALPYDRPATTMAGFPLCPACDVEYRDPRDRRYHAQPIACPDCGPRLTFHGRAGERHGTDAAIAAVHAVWATGGIVAVKGIGGYHLTCDAASVPAVALLRERKGRGGKPFAVMVRDLATARTLAALDAAEERALASPARPIVLVRRAADAAVAALVAPDSADLGIVLAYSGLHHLLLSPVPTASVAPPRVIVATSGNRAAEPICVDDADARERLGDLADAFLVHDRPIHVPCDDSVVRVLDGSERPVRRSRGYAPLPVALPVAVAPVLAVGGELKNTFCVAVGDHAWLGQHVGDLGNLETLAAFERGVEQFQAMYRVDPAVIATDAHPRYLTRRWALAQRGTRPVVEVQHHHAHVASLLAEHGLDGTVPVVGIALDGTGYGTALDGGAAIWGGEVLVADYDRFERVGHLAELPLPGGDAAVENPCRTALAYLAACGIALDDDLAPVGAADVVERRVIARQVEIGTGVVATTSMGRLFDAVASLLDVRHRVTYEAEAAMALEALAATAAASWPLAFAIGADGVIDPAPLLRDLAAATRAGSDPGRLALGFHEAVATAFAAVAARAAADAGVDTVGLTGGVFGNALLSRCCRAGLAAAGLMVLEHRLVPANDGGLALGQAMIAGRRIERERTRS